VIWPDIAHRRDLTISIFWNIIQSELSELTYVD
jgi:hypothetical protein